MTACCAPENGMEAGPDTGATAIEPAEHVAPPAAPQYMRDLDQPLDWVKGWYHSYETAGTVDGPGIRFVVFVTGCPLRCVYCHNPDTWHRKCGREIEAGAIVGEIRDYRRYIQKHGGVTISGGEPLSQPLFTTAILHGCKQAGLHTALDTSGFLGRLATDEMLELVDLVLLDIKSFDPEIYRNITGQDVKPTLDFARRLERMGKPMWIRFVLTPGYSDDRDNITALAEFVGSLTNVERIEVLPFHKMGEHKWQALGLAYKLDDIVPPSADEAEAVRDIFRAHAPGVLVA